MAVEVGFVNRAADAGAFVFRGFFGKETNPLW
jgi:hypothetical protein